MGKQYKFKVALIGDFGTGKTSIFRRLVDGQFAENPDSDVQADFAELQLQYKGDSVKVLLWDTAGMEEHNSIEGSYFRGLAGFLLVYDVCTWKSYERIEHWRSQVEAFGLDGAKCVLIGNKYDVPQKQRVVESFEGKNAAAKLRIPFFETSARDGKNVREALEALVGLIIDEKLPNIEVGNENESTGQLKEVTLTTPSGSTKTKTKCCSS